MSEQDSDGIEQAIEGAVRVAIASGATAGVQLMRMRQQQDQEKTERQQQSAHEMAQRREALWQDTRAELAPIMEDRWWQEASPEQIGHAHTLATAWQGHDEVAPFAERIRHQVRERYGVDVEEVTAAELADRLDGTTQEDEAEKDRAEAQRLMEEADRADREGAENPEAENQERDRATQDEADARLMYDSAERRESMASNMRQAGIEPEVVNGRVRADAGQAHPPTEAVRRPGARTPQARRNRRGVSQQRDRSRSR